MTDARARFQERAAHAAGQRWTAATLRERVRRGERSWLRCALVVPADWVAAVLMLRSHATCVACDGTGLAPLMRGVELAAYCGDAAARELLGWGCCAKHRAAKRLGPPGFPLVVKVGKHCAEDPLPAWLRGLARWGQDALVRAAVAAAREAWPELHRACQGCGTAWRPFANRPWRCDCGKAWAAIEAAEAWLACPCEEHVWGIVTRCQQTTSPDDWLWWLGEVFACLRAQTSPTDATVECVSQIARLLGDEARVRAAICRALIPVALGEEA